MSGDNTEDSARVEELEAKLKAQKEETDKVVAETAKQKEIIENAESLVNRQGNELGELRKKVEAIETAEPPKKDKDGKVITEPPEEETSDEIEKSLDDKQKSLVEGMFENLSDDEKLKYANDDAFRMKVLKAAQADQSVPESPWKNSKTEKKTTDSDDKRIAELFGIAKSKRAFTPSGPRGGSRSASGRSADSTEKEERSPIAQGVLGHGRR